MNNKFCILFSNERLKRLIISFVFHIKLIRPVNALSPYQILLYIGLLPKKLLKNYPDLGFPSYAGLPICLDGVDFALRLPKRLYLVDTIYLANQLWRLSSILNGGSLLGREFSSLSLCMYYMLLHTRLLSLWILPTTSNWSLRM